MSRRYEGISWLSLISIMLLLQMAMRLLNHADEGKLSPRCVFHMLASSRLPRLPSLE